MMVPLFPVPSKTFPAGESPIEKTRSSREVHTESGEPSGEMTPRPYFGLFTKSCVLFPKEARAVYHSVTTGPRSKQIVVTLSVEEHRALQLFAKAKGITQDEAAAHLITDGLAGNGAMSGVSISHRG